MMQQTCNDMQQDNIMLISVTLICACNVHVMLFCDELQLAFVLCQLAMLLHVSGQVAYNNFVA